MKNNYQIITQWSIIILIALSFQACVSKIPVELKEVEQSKNDYDVKGEETVKQVSLQNNLSLEDKVITGIFEEIMHLQQNEKDIENYAFVKDAMIAEFKARNLPINFIDNENNEIKIDKFELFTHRSSGFSPLVTFSMLKVSAVIDGKKKEFSSIVKRGKVPVWQFKEVNDPCFNEPIMIMIKEIVAKINKEYFNYKLSDNRIAQVENSILKGIENKDPLNYMNIYELGFSNNKKALDTLISYSNNSDEYLRLASISMLGLIGGESQFEYLVSKYKNSKIWQDRALALKAIGDIKTKRAKEFIEKEYNTWKVDDSKEGKWHKMLIEVYKS